MPSAVSMSADVLSELRTDPDEMDVEDETDTDGEVSVVDEVDVDGVVTAPADVTLDVGAVGTGTGAGTGVGDVLEAGAVLVGSGGGGAGLVVGAGEAAGVVLADADEVVLVDAAVDDVEFVDDVVLADEVVAGGATGGVDAAGALVTVEDVVVDLSVSVPAPPRKTTGMVD